MFSWLFSIFGHVIGGIAYFILVYIPLWILNIFYNIFKLVGSGFSSAIFHTSIIDGRLIWQFNWGGQVLTIVMCLIIVSVVLWLFYLLMKVARQNARRRLGNGGEVSTHLRYGLGFALFMVLSPFVMMIFSTLLTILISIFNKNQNQSLTAEEVTGLKIYLLQDLNQLSQITGVKIDVAGSSYSIVQSLQTMITSLNNAITDANAQGRSDIANNLQKTLTDVQSLLTYIQSGQFTSDINELTNIINNLNAGQQSFDLSNRINEISTHLNQINTLFNNIISDYSLFNASDVKDLIISWNSRNADIFNYMDGIKSSLNNFSNANYLGFYLDPQHGLLNTIFEGDKQQIGLVALQMRLSGMVDFDLVGKIFNFITGKPANQWNSTFFGGWGNTGIINIVIGFMTTVIADLIMIMAAWRVAQGWVIIFAKWFGAIPVIARGNEGDLKTHIGEMFTIWIELFFTYLFFEIAIIAIPYITVPIDATGIIGKGTSLLFIDAAMAVALMQSRRSAMLFGVSDGIDYYAKNTTIGQGINKVQGSVGKGVKIGKQIFGGGD